MSEDIVIGLEFSTQSAKAVVLGLSTATVLATYQLSYDMAFPRYGTKGGVLPASDPAVRHTSPAMLVEGMDELLRRLSADGVDLSRVQSIKLDAQQHCTVCADESLSERLRNLSPSASLVKQVVAALTRESSPIWEDRSTLAQARLLEERLATYGGVKRLTANRAELRFPAAQILKWGMEAPADYQRTSHIMLLSAFLTSLLVGSRAPVDTGDGWGTNLNSTDITCPSWNAQVVAALEATLGEVGATSSLAEKLGSMDHYDTPVGTVSKYFVDAYSMNPHATILCGTGDNPATLLGCGGKLVVSLGSSYTVNGILAPEVGFAAGDYNVFGYVPGRAMALSVITNGTKVHDAFRRRFAAGREWTEYANIAGERRVSSEEPLLLPYLQDESVPLKPSGVVREGLNETDERANIRALHLSQALALRLHASHVSEPESIAVVGGGSRNDTLRAFLTDAFGVPTYRIRNGDFAAPLGCAIAAARHVLDISYEDSSDRFVQIEAGSRMEPVKSNVAVHEKLVERYAALEQSV
jgi:xylulokinase